METTSAASPGFAQLPHSGRRASGEERRNPAMIRREAGLTRELEAYDAP